MDTKILMLQKRIEDLEILVARLCEDSHGFHFNSHRTTDMRESVQKQEERVADRAKQIQKELE